jgi:hypothetical protein
MKAHLLWIGMIDEGDRANFVPLYEGVNVVTGRSSTGKSALIEIFDYCFGSSDYTVPSGVITENAHLFFVVLKLRDSLLVLARLPNKGRVFLREEFNLELAKRTDWIRSDYFERGQFMALSDYLSRLKGYFGVVVTDIDEDPEARRQRGRKLPTPSVRSFTSFMLQHQNLVANKHAIFYRFDEKEKREQAIDHLKIFLGFADQNYFMLKQKEHELDMQYRQLLRTLPRQKEREQSTQERLELAHNWLEAASGKEFAFDVQLALKNPAVALEQLRTSRVTFKADSNVHVRQLQEAQNKKGSITARIRKLQLALAEVTSSQEFSTRYEQARRTTPLPQHAHLEQGECPFCHTGNLSVEPEANQLAAAIDWLNSELGRTSYRRAAFNEEQARIEGELKEVRAELRAVDEHMDGLRKQINDLNQVRNQYEMTVAARTRLETALEDWLQERTEGKDVELAQLQADLKDVHYQLNSRYDMRAKLEQAQGRITELMEHYGERFDFEAGYKPIHLRLSLDTFDLWHQVNERERVFLRAMGSGANWLASHLVLFLSLQRYFCELGDSCSIPPILFLDQPSQVYFPAVLDAKEEFDAQNLARSDATRDAERRSVDEDLAAVANLFDQLVQHCDETEKATGIRPQIIVTDHADHLKLRSGTKFESLVRARWREKGAGFIDLRGIYSNDA